MAKQPVHEIRMGAVKAAVWQNESDHGVRHNVTFQRLYKDEEDEWQSTSSFGRDDLPLLSKVADAAFTWIYADGASQSSHDDEDEAPRRRGKTRRGRR